MNELSLLGILGKDFLWHGSINKHNFGEESLKHGVKPSLKMVLVFKAINTTISAYCNDALLFHAQKRRCVRRKPWWYMSVHFPT